MLMGRGRAGLRFVGLDIWLARDGSWDVDGDRIVVAVLERMGDSGGVGGLYAWDGSVRLNEARCVFEDGENGGESLPISFGTGRSNEIPESLLRALTFSSLTIVVDGVHEPSAVPGRVSSTGDEGKAGLNGGREVGEKGFWCSDVVPGRSIVQTLAIVFTAVGA